MSRVFQVLLKSPKDPKDTLVLHYRLRDTDIAKKHFKCLYEAEAKGFGIRDPDRFLNFPGDVRDGQWFADRLNAAIAAINDYSPGLIKVAAWSDMPQETLNELHHYFEVYRGGVLSAARFYTEAPHGVQRALEDLNIYIHQFEGYKRNQQRLQIGRQPDALAKLTWDGSRPRFDLTEDDYKLFTRQAQFGVWALDYCEVGKPLWDVYRDNDEIVGDANIRPQRYYSADAYLRFGDTQSDESYANDWEDFCEWWRSKNDKLEKLGFKMNDPRNAVGWIPVADLAAEIGDTKGLSEMQIIELVGRYQYFQGVRTGL